MSPLCYEIKHRLEYQYSVPVFLEAHTLFFRPRSDGTQKLIDFNLSILPEPMMHSEKLDPFGNNPSRVWFADSWNKLVVNAVSRVEVNRDNPFDYLVEPNCLQLPAHYSPALSEALRIYLPVRENHPAVKVYSDRIARIAGANTIRFLFHLAMDIGQTFKKIVRETGEALLPSKTLQTEEGTCRDLAVLFIECCRMQGLAARFTSGYCSSDENNFDHELHAWVEVYLEGGGWRGYDPSSGIAVSDGHIAVASAPEFFSVSPVQGTFRGTGAKSTMTASVSISRIKKPTSGRKAVSRTAKTGS
ncbi:MAG: transglutaminase family protein [Candidatus Omnitrophica bacterium]|nr:transglutaminase family protein [Candidatus Omnitrophota bacterium]